MCVNSLPMVVTLKADWPVIKPSQSQVQCPNHCITSHCSVYNTHVCLLFVGGPVPVCCVCVCLRTVINGWSSACERLWERRRWPPDVAFSQRYVRHISSCEAVHSSNTRLHPFNGPLSGTTWVSRYQKGKTNLDFTEARDSEWQWHQLGHYASLHLAPDR